jgi:tRNA dimethylallyltransferase
MKEKRILVIAGPTASRKSSLALGIARENNGVIITADSIQLYRGLPILSAQPGSEDLKVAEHKLYNVLFPRERGTLFDWLNRVKREIKETLERGKLAIIVGGTGLYVSRLLGGMRMGIPETDQTTREELNTMYNELGRDKFFEIVQRVDPEATLNVDPSNRHRLLRIYEVYRLSGKRLSELRNIPNGQIIDRSKVFLVNIIPERKTLYEKCNLRFRNMLASGALEETELFMRNYPNIFGSDLPIVHTIGFREIGRYLRNELEYEHMVELATRDTRHYAKRQYTWFRNQFTDVDHRIDHIPSEGEIDRIAKDVIGRL